MSGLKMFEQEAVACLGIGGGGEVLGLAMAGSEVEKGSSTTFTVHDLGDPGVGGGGGGKMAVSLFRAEGGKALSEVLSERGRRVHWRLLGDHWVRVLAKRP